MKKKKLAVLPNKVSDKLQAAIDEFKRMYEADITDEDAYRLMHGPAFFETRCHITRNGEKHFYVKNVGGHGMRKKMHLNVSAKMPDGVLKQTSTYVKLKPGYEEGVNGDGLPVEQDWIIRVGHKQVGIILGQKLGVVANWDSDDSTKLNLTISVSVPVTKVQTDVEVHILQGTKWLNTLYLDLKMLARESVTSYITNQQFGETAGPITVRVVTWPLSQDVIVQIPEKQIAVEAEPAPVPEPQVVPVTSPAPDPEQILSAAPLNPPPSVLHPAIRPVFADEAHLLMVFYRDINTLMFALKNVTDKDLENRLLFIGGTGWGMPPQMKVSIRAGKTRLFSLTLPEDQRFPEGKERDLWFNDHLICKWDVPKANPFAVTSSMVSLTRARFEITRVADDMPGIENFLVSSDPCTNPVGGLAKVLYMKRGDKDGVSYEGVSEGFLVFMKNNATGVIAAFTPGVIEQAFPVPEFANPVPG